MLPGGERLLGLRKIRFICYQEVSGSSVPSILHQTGTTKEPPTFNKTDKFTSGFQNLIDSFGFANYREVNPGKRSYLKGH